MYELKEKKEGSQVVKFFVEYLIDYLTQNPFW